jgi:LacI family transcriptional regulator
MKDIARDLGVSVVTISKVLRNHADISSATRERVLRRVKELGYRPNAMARSLVTGRSSLVGFVVPDLLHTFFSEIAMGLSAALRRKDYCLIVTCTDEQPAIEAVEIEKLMAHRLDALVIAPSGNSPDLFARFQAQGTPLVLLDRFIDGFACDFVGTDDYAVGALAAKHLIEVGCRRIAHLRGPDNSVGRLRFQGYRDTLEKYNLPVLEEYIIKGSSSDMGSEREGIEAMKQLLARKRQPDGVFCFNDTYAVGAMKVLLDAAVRIPDEVALIGCGNIHYAEMLRIPLSSIDQSGRQMGERIGKLLIRILSGKRSSRPRKIVFPPQLVVRASTARRAR